MSDRFTSLEIIQSGEKTVVGFGNRDVLDQINIAACREQIEELVRRTGTKVLAFDLLGVRLIPSGMLGLLAALRNLGVKVQIFNPSDDVREVLEITKLNQLLEVREGQP